MQSGPATVNTYTPNPKYALLMGTLLPIQQPLSAPNLVRSGKYQLPKSLKGMRRILTVPKKHLNASVQRLDADLGPVQSVASGETRNFHPVRVNLSIDVALSVIDSLCAWSCEGLSKRALHQCKDAIRLQRSHEPPGRRSANCVFSIT
jgi:hypothetical protein